MRETGITVYQLFNTKTREYSNTYTSPNNIFGNDGKVWPKLSQVKSHIRNSGMCVQYEMHPENFRIFEYEINPTIVRTLNLDGTEHLDN